MHLVLMGALAMAAFVVFVAELKLAQDLVRYRTDISTKQSWSEGWSVFPQLNVSSAANYLPEGLPGLRRLRLLAAVRVLLMLLIFLTFVWAYVLH